MKITRARNHGMVSASTDDPNRTSKKPQMNVNSAMKLPKLHAYARTFQKPAATQNQISARIAHQKIWPHCGELNATSLPTKVQLMIPAKIRIRQICTRPAS